MFKKGGFPSPQIFTRTGTGRFRSIHAMVGADLRGWLPLMGVELPEPLIEEILLESEKALAKFVKDGEVMFESPPHIVAASKPH